MCIRAVMHHSGIIVGKNPNSRTPAQKEAASQGQTPFALTQVVFGKEKTLI